MGACLWVSHRQPSKTNYISNNSAYLRLPWKNTALFSSLFFISTSLFNLLVCPVPLTPALWNNRTIFLGVTVIRVATRDKSHSHTHTHTWICKAWEWDSKLYWNKVPNSHPHADWGICKQEDKRQNCMWIQNSPQKDELLHRLSTADSLTLINLLPTECFTQLYNPLHPKVHTVICWLQNCIAK